MLCRKNEGFTTAGQVQYVARAGNFAKEGFAYTGLLQIVKVMMNYDYLWQNIRVLGGAYGCMSAFGRGGTWRGYLLVIHSAPDFIESAL